MNFSILTLEKSLNFHICFSGSVIFQKFIQRCNILSTRHKSRLIVETVVFFLIPAFLSAALYIKVGVTLKRQKKRAERNRVLTLAFALSWLAWVICWSPNVLVVAKENYETTQYWDDYLADYKSRNQDYLGYYYEYNDYYSNPRDFGKNISDETFEILYEYWDYYDGDYESTRMGSSGVSDKPRTNLNDEYEINFWDEYREDSRFDDNLYMMTFVLGFRVSLQLLYSHLNPLFYLLVLKKFQEHHANAFLWIIHLFFYRKRKYKQSSSSAEKSAKTSKSECSKVFKTALISLSLIFLASALLHCVYYETKFSEHTAKVQKDSNYKLRKLSSDLQKRNMNDLGVFKISDSTLRIRQYCGDLRGVINVDYQRCFILSTHLPNYLNFTEHLNFCESGGTTMCYPRSHDEMVFMWNMLATWSETNFDTRLPWAVLKQNITIESHV